MSLTTHDDAPTTRSPLHLGICSAFALFIAIPTGCDLGEDPGAVPAESACRADLDRVKSIAEEEEATVVRVQDDSVLVRARDGERISAFCTDDVLTIETGAGNSSTTLVAGRN